MRFTLFKQYSTYILSNKRNTVLYVGMTNDLLKRPWQHKNKVDPHSFTARYNVNKLVYYELYENVEASIIREKQLKAGSRKKKVALIESMNPEWRDLYEDLLKG